MKKHTDPHTMAKGLGLEYSGDMNVEHGGLFFDTENWQADGYATAIRITDLGSACGFEGAVLIECITVLKPSDIGWASSFIGWEGEADSRVEIDACMAYGHYDPCEDYMGPSSEVVQTEPDDGPM